ncbi:MAG TPA: TolC family protein [Saprospiraceae bacterium]|nr:TolC family protein [Saprospiraceae bacterium]
MIKKINILLLLLLGWSVVKAQTINELLELSMTNSPKLHAVELEYDAALKVKNQVNELPDPQVGLGLPVLRTETRLGAPILSVNVSQMFPWKGTLAAKENVAIAMSKTKFDEIEATRLDMEYQIRTAYYQLYLLNQRQEILQENLKVNDALEQVVLGRVESGQAIGSDVLRIQIKSKEMKQKIKIYESQKRKFQAQILELVGEDALPNNQVVIVDSELEQMPILNEDLLATAFAKIQSNYPMLKKLDAMITASKAVQELDDLSEKPAFGVGLSYSLVQKRSDANPTQNGRDLLMPTFRMSVPIFRKKYDAKNQEEILKQKAFSEKRMALELKIKSMLKISLSDYEQAELELDLAKEQRILTESAFNMLLSAYSAKGQRFNELLKLQDQLYDYKLQEEIGKVKLFLAKANWTRFGMD